MPSIDLQAAADKRYDVCIVGSGPAGLSAALSLAKKNVATLLIDAGGDRPAAGPPADRCPPEKHPPLSDTHCRALGGTSWLWGGRIIPISKPEFEEAGWPVAYEDFAPYLDKAAEFLGGSTLQRPYVAPITERSFDLDAIEVLGPEKPLSELHDHELRSAQTLDILLRSTVVGLVYEDGLSKTICRGLRVRSSDDGATQEIRTGTTVLALGGLETTRLLLADQARNPRHLGHLRALGSTYTGHLTGSIADITFARKADTRIYGWQALPRGGFKRRVFRSTARAIAAGQNIFFWARNSKIQDAHHGSGLLSAKHLVKHLLLARPQEEDGPSSPPLEHLRTIITDAPTTLAAMPALLGARLDRRRKRLDHLIPNRHKRFRLSYHAEQEMRVENRVEIVGPVRQDTLADIRIHFDFSDNDFAAVVAAHNQLQTELVASGIGRLSFRDADEARFDAVKQMASDGRHQIGTARMGTDPLESVVDPSCGVHKVAGLYIAGSCIFPSGAAVPPTQSIVAFSLRLADLLAAKIKEQTIGRC